jgi:hypothetical protein
MVDSGYHRWSDYWHHRHSAGHVLRAGMHLFLLLRLPVLILRQLANLTVEYGLYTSFVGVLIYCVSARPLSFSKIEGRSVSSSLLQKTLPSG